MGWVFLIFCFVFIPPSLLASHFLPVSPVCVSKYTVHPQGWPLSPISMPLSGLRWSSLFTSVSWPSVQRYESLQNSPFLHEILLRMTGTPARTISEHTTSPDHNIVVLRYVCKKMSFCLTICCVSI